MTEGRRFDELRAVVRRSAAEGEVTPYAICRTAVDYLDVTAAAVTVPDGLLGAQTIGAHGMDARRLEELQVTIGEGPSLDGLTRHVEVVIEDVGLAQYRGRWPLFATAAAESSMRALCVSPMLDGARGCGVLTVYLDRTLGRNEACVAEARVLAAITLEVLLRHPRSAPRAGEAYLHDLWFFDDRPEIHQATGMVATQLAVDLNTALLRIRGRAFAESRMLSEVALDVVLGEARFDEKEQV